VGLDGAFGYKEALGNLGVAQVLTEQAEDLGFPGRRLQLHQGHFGRFKPTGEPN
jgi:hypothetical protein